MFKFEITHLPNHIVIFVNNNSIKTLNKIFTLKNRNQISYLNKKKAMDYNDDNLQESQNGFSNAEIRDQVTF